MIIFTRGENGDMLTVGTQTHFLPSGVVTTEPSSDSRQSPLHTQPASW